MNSDLGLTPIRRLDFVLRSAIVVFSEIHMYVHVIIRKILFNVALLCELSRYSKHVTAETLDIFNNACAELI